MRRWVAAAGLIVAVGCGSSSSATTATSAPTTTEAPGTVTFASTTTVVPAAPQATPDAAASAVIAAWKAGDRGSAAQVATAAAVDALFAQPPDGVVARGCMQGAADPRYCVYRTDAGELQLKLTMGGGGWYVLDAVFGTG